MKHYDALKKLIPIELGQIFDKDMTVEGALYDSIAERLADLSLEFFPSTTTALLEQWEAEFGLTPQSGATIDQRRAALCARYIDIGNMSRNYFVNLAHAMGYEIDIVEGGEANRLFLAGISKAGDPVYFETAIWEWKVITLNKPPAADIINTFKDLNPPHLALTFEDGS